MTEYAIHFRTRRAMTCVECDPRSKMTIVSTMGLIEFKTETNLLPFAQRFGEKKVVRLFIEKNISTFGEVHYNVRNAGKTTRRGCPASEMDAGVDHSGCVVAVSCQAVQCR